MVEPSALESAEFTARYRTEKSVGKGSFGEAVLCRSKADGKRYIVKAIETKGMSAKEKRDVQNEIAILSHVNHPNIVRYHEHFIDGTLIFIAMEYADGGDVYTRLKQQKAKDPVVPLNPQLVLYWFLQVCLAIKYLHDHHILHRDLKTANIFLTSKDVVKLGDFGISTVLQNTVAYAKTVCGTPYYFSPELCQSKPYNNKSDIWALGVVLYEMLSLQRPFNAKSLKELVKKVVVGMYDPLPSTVPLEMRNLCASLLQVNPVQRPNINRVLEYPFVQSSLKSFSADLETQTIADKEKLEREGTARPTQSQTPKASPAQAAKPMTDREQLAMLRGLGREQIKALMSDPKAVEQLSQQSARVEAATDHPDVDDDGEHIAQRQAIAKQSREYVGAGPLGGHEDFGDGPPDAAAQELVPLPDGTTVTGDKARQLIAAVVGEAVLTAAIDYVSNAMSSHTAPTNAEIQATLARLLGRHSSYVQAISKLAVWESKKD